MTYIIPTTPFPPKMFPNPTVHIHGAVQQAMPDPAGEFSPKKAGTKTSHTVFILDDSGSMQSCRKQTIDGFNEFLKGQQASDIATFVSLYKFDGSNVTCVHDHVSANSVEPLNMNTYNPRGGTNLLDAMGAVMNKVNERLASTKKKHRDQVTIVVLTDGAENASRSYNNAAIKTMVEKAEAKDWTYMFLGANIDAFGVGASLGFRQDNTIQYDTANMSATFASTTRMSNDLKMAKFTGMNNADAYAAAAFTDEERSSAVGEDK